MDGWKDGKGRERRAREEKGKLRDSWKDGKGRGER